MNPVVLVTASDQAAVLPLVTAITVPEIGVYPERAIPVMSTFIHAFAVDVNVLEKSRYVILLFSLKTSLSEDHRLQNNM